MARYLVVRAWLVEADSATDAIEEAKPGEHHDVRAMLVFKSVPSVMLKFGTSEIVNLDE
jgi:hypothetical protein